MINLTKKVLTQALDHGASGTLVVDIRGGAQKIVYANSAFTGLTGWDPAELIGRPLKDFVVSGDLPGKDAAEVRQQWRCRGSGPRNLDLQLAPLYQRPGIPDFLLLSHAGTSSASFGERRRVEPLRTDPQTGLANRRSFEEALRRDWGMARRDARPVALIVFQIDAFASYREVFGRHAEEACLTKVAHAIQGALHRAGDLAARLDADRFAVLAGSSNVTQVEGFAADIANRVRRLAIHHPRSPVARYVTVSAGAASLVPAKGQGAEDLLEEATGALAGGIAVSPGTSRVGA
ncbi:MAG: sensor domain-containing diguanylate cyclase [Gammaproteobacteria bacterium]